MMVGRQGVAATPSVQPAPTPLVGPLSAVCLFCPKVGVSALKGVPDHWQLHSGSAQLLDA
jgi:hypothetical protein